MGKRKKGNIQFAAKSKIAKVTRDKNKLKRIKKGKTAGQKLADIMCGRA